MVNSPISLWKWHLNGSTSSFHKFSHFLNDCDSAVWADLYRICNPDFQFDVSFLLQDIKYDLRPRILFLFYGNPLPNTSVLWILIVECQNAGDLNIQWIITHTIIMSNVPWINSIIYGKKNLTSLFASIFLPHFVTLTYISQCPHSHWLPYPHKLV